MSLSIFRFTQLRRMIHRANSNHILAVQRLLKSQGSPRLVVVWAKNRGFGRVNAGIRMCKASGFSEYSKLALNDFVARRGQDHSRLTAHFLRTA